MSSNDFICFLLLISSILLDLFCCRNSKSDLVLLNATCFKDDVFHVELDGSHFSGLLLKQGLNVRIPYFVKFKIMIWLGFPFVLAQVKIQSLIQINDALA